MKLFPPPVRSAYQRAMIDSWSILLILAVAMILFMTTGYDHSHNGCRRARSGSRDRL